MLNSPAIGSSLPRCSATQIISPVFEKLAQSDEYKDKAGFYTVRAARACAGGSSLVLSG